MLRAVICLGGGGCRIREVGISVVVGSCAAGVRAGLRSGASGPAFGSFLKVLFDFAHQRKWLKYEDWKSFGRCTAHNDEKAKQLVSVFAKHPETILIIDDNSTVTAGNRPWLEQLVDSCIVIAGIEPSISLRLGRSGIGSALWNC
ncbi:hypothetical protein [Rubritalea tangerina]|uniref:hypothetical protein n=1 Tax=Rubritalea tangerina TaxID=430798 RepID=UPI003620D951